MKNKKKTATVPKTLRGKKRYWLLCITSPALLSAPIVTRGLLGFFRELYGSVGLGRQKLSVVEFNPANGCLIVQCALEHSDDVLAGFVLWNQIQNQAIKPQVLLKTGSLKRAREKAQRKA